MKLKVKICHPFDFTHLIYKLQFTRIIFSWLNRSDIGKVFVGGRGIMRRVNEFFRQDVKIRSNQPKEEYRPPCHLPCVKGDNGWERVGWWGHSCELKGVPRNI